MCPAPAIAGPDELVGPACAAVTFSPPPACGPEAQRVVGCGDGDDAAEDAKNLRLRPILLLGESVVVRPLPIRPCPGGQRTG